MRVGIALGSNQGDRLRFIRIGCEFLKSMHEEPGPFLVSKIYQTEPVDCPPGSPAFYNAAVELSTKLPPLELLRLLQAQEQKLGRPVNHGFHEPRPLDLDILYYDHLQLSLDELTLPHPRISERLFVLAPLNDLCPQRILPGQDRNVCELFELQSKAEKSKCISKVDDSARAI